MKSTGTKSLGPHSEAAAAGPAFLIRLLAVTLTVAPTVMRSATTAAVNSKAASLDGFGDRIPMPTLDVQSIAAPLKHFAGVTCARFSPDGRRVATADENAIVRLWDAKKGVELASTLGHGAAIPAVEFSPDGQCLATGSKDGTLRLWSGTTGALLAGPLAGHRDSVVWLSFSPAQGHLVTASLDGTAILWRITPRSPDP